MTSFRFFWTAHKWTGIAIAVLLVLSATTGFLLLIKKNVDWIQPPLVVGTEGPIEDFVPLHVVVASILAEDHPDFSSPADIDRIDTRVEQWVHKVRSRHNYTEFQVDAITGSIISGPMARTSDLIESLHDGSFFAGWFHDWVMPLSSAGLLFLVFSGFWLWISTKVPKYRRKKRR